ncbi:hypothetical protein ACH4NS_01810 [Streptomyces mutabilis]|uniref:Secreted protein n=1 Tax=Streptomyces mutabilis TaxID=67332 RepID=A0A086N2X5_9ACTN|nr:MULTISPECIES: hypothetical protein [Streptomyces]MDG9690664.1 hypothetical protein [Streptomyces sp. DH17]OSC59661.1 hypothetical protein B5181_30055 [Streptomyces sp. 4F]KFG75493.1 hypothetical protein FM21_04970 [Streptomyces mutabilis]MDN3251431.1 hypothetical protein [Streptomyces sp. MA25(2023)]MDQ0387778.1 hypothetical protein [Streptomyces sp. DSM 42143]
MAALAPLLLPAPSKPVAEPSTPWAEPSAASDTPHYCVFGATGSCAETPLTSEPPLPDAEPLTSESPFADAVPLTSESSPELTADVPEQGGPSFAVPEPTRS